MDQPEAGCRIISRYGLNYGVQASSVSYDEIVPVAVQVWDSAPWSPTSSAGFAPHTPLGRFVAPQQLTVRWEGLPEPSVITTRSLISGHSESAWSLWRCRWTFPKFPSR